MASTLQVNADAGCLSVEMENSTLFCVGSIRGIRTGAIGTIDGSPFLWDEGDYDPHGETVKKGKERMILTGLKVGKKIALETGCSSSQGGSDSDEEKKKQDDNQVEEEADDRQFGPEQSKHLFDLVKD